jgi:hypothetical protein
MGKEASSMVRSSWIGALVGVLACAALTHAQSTQAERFVMIREAGKPPQKCRVLKCWKDRDGNQVCQVQAVDSGEMMTIQDPHPTPGIPPVRTLLGSRLFHWGADSTPPSGTPQAPSDATVLASPKPATRPSLLNRMFASSRPRVTTAVVQAEPSADKPTVVATSEPPKAQVDLNKAPDWRQSWGKVERWTPADAEKAAQFASVKADAVQPGPQLTRMPPDMRPAPVVVVRSESAKQAVMVSEPAKPAVMVSEPARPTMVVSEVTTPPQAQVIESSPSRPVSPWFRKKMKRSTETYQESPTVVRTEAMPKVQQEEGLWAMLTSRDRAAKAAASPMPMQGMTPGMGPVHAVDSPHLVLAPPMPTPSVAATAPNAFTVVMQGAPAGTTPPGGGLPAGMMLAQTGVPDGMGNAFTTAGTTRPIPADLTRSYYEPNGFQENGMGGAERRPVLSMAPAQPMGLVMMPHMVPVMPMAMPAQAPGSGHLLAKLRDSVMPSEREMAAEELSRCDWRRDPQVVPGLVQAAKCDPAPAVRACCVRALARMKVNTMPVVTAVMTLKTDSDVRVRQEVEQALAVMTAAQ